MRFSQKATAIAALMVMASCDITVEHSDAPASGAAAEISMTREQFWAAARAGNVDSMLAFHLDTATYKLYENGGMYDYAAQADGHKAMKDLGVNRIEFNVRVMDTVVFNRSHAMETWDGTTVTWLNSGQKDTSGRFFVTILYTRTPEGWKFSYLHSSSKPSN
ncbi:MAG TPA: nuclear transport factor 2 family protein [Chitinophagaceae bacterium]|nr:nuclear transport factor 2 family protein [Chitinophagaceae bacterium]